jgi:hypothetical protein
MNTITLGEIEKHAPAAWSELTDEQLLIWVKICAKNVEPEQALLFVSSAFYGIPKRLFFKLNAAQMIALADDFKFLLINNLYAWLIPEIKVGWRKKFHGPADRFSTSSIAEFRTCESYYHAYKHTGKEYHLDLLIASLYRPLATGPLSKLLGDKNNGKDGRKLFSEVDVVRHAHRMRKLDKHLRAAILFNYEGCRSFVVKRYPTVFITSDGEASNRLPEINPLIKTIAGGKFGTYKETENTDLYLFLDHLRDEIEESNKK